MFLNKTVSDILKKPNDFILFTDDHGISIETSFSNQRLVLLLPWVPDLRGFRFRSLVFLADSPLVGSAERSVPAAREKKPLVPSRFCC